MVGDQCWHFGIRDQLATVSHRTEIAIRVLDTQGTLVANPSMDPLQIKLLASLLWFSMTYLKGKSLRLLGKGSSYCGVDVLPLTWFLNVSTLESARLYTDWKAECPGEKI